MTISGETQYLPFELGEFSVRSFGITINIPQLGPLLPYVGAFFLSGEEPARKVAFLSQAIDKAPDDRSRFILMGYGTVFLHELRHFHDYLSTPFGATIMGDHMLATRYVVPTLAALASEPTLGFPIQRWSTLSDRMHAAYRNGTKSKQFSRVPPTFAVKAAESAGSIFARIRDWHGRSCSGGTMDVTTQHLMESSAIEMQCGQVFTLFGYDQLVLFVDQLKHNDPGGLYTHMWSTYDKLGPGYTAAIRNAIMFMAMCGTTEAKPNEHCGHPVDRFFSITRHIAMTGWKPDESVVLDMLDDWATTHSMPTMVEALKKSAEKSTQLAQALRSLAQQETEKMGHDLLHSKDLLSAHEAWAEAHSYMCNRIIEDPMEYFEPNLYMANINKRVAAPSYITTDTMFFGPKNPMFPQFEEKGWSSVFAGLDDDGDVAWRMAANPELSVGLPMISAKTAHLISVFVWQAYLFWSEGMLTPLLRDVAAEVVRQGNPTKEVLLL